MQKQLAAQKIGIAANVEAASFACMPFVRGAPCQDSQIKLTQILAALNAEASFGVQCKVALDGDARGVGVDPAAAAGSLYIQLPREDQAALEADGSPKVQLGTSRTGRPTSSRWASPRSQAPTPRH